MQTLVADHPLIAHKLTMLRDVNTETPVFRSLTDELVTLLAYEATRDVRTERVTVRTPVAEAEGVRLARPKPLVIPVLRAGIGMLDGMARLLPKADVGFVGLARDEKTLVASTYATRLPADLTGRDTFVLDPMLATGGTLVTVFEMLASRGAASMTAICLLAAPEGIERVSARFGDDFKIPVRIVSAGLDDRLNERGYIVPGLGDAGDRLFGEI
jgi:uracil phosphoribosyltransferase